MELTDRLRSELKKPLGKLVEDTSSVSDDKVLVCVGDTASDTFLNRGYFPKLIVYDGLARRKKIGVSEPIKSYAASQYTVSNPPGNLNEEVIDLFREVFGKPGKAKVYVEGEEDLTALAAILAAPAGALVVYGQPDEGLVVVEVDEAIKDKIQGYIGEMKDGS